jgi:hypothetical protein
VTDERGDPVPDYSVTLLAARGAGHAELLREFEGDVHSYQRDQSFRSFHICLSDLFAANYEPVTRREMELTASSGTRLVSYAGESDPVGDPTALDEVCVDLTPLLNASDRHDEAFTFFYPFTTTFVEICVERA